MFLPMEMPSTMQLVYLLVMVFLTIVYFTPSLFALKICHSQTVPIALANLLVGWTGVGWLACLIWALSEVTFKVNITVVDNRD